LEPRETTSLPTELRIWPSERYLAFHKRSLEDAEKFWSEVARDLDWYKTWDKVLEWNEPFAKWFVGGKINASYNCIDRHVKTWRRNKAAYIWEGEPGDSRVLTYQDLYREVNEFASVLWDLGVKKGDKITIYLPMVPELPISMLAAARIGATFSVVFSGFSAAALSGRIDDSESSLVITADGGFRRGKVIRLKAIVDEAVATSSSNVKKIIVLKRTGDRISMESGRDFWWHDLMEGHRRRIVEPIPVESTHPLYLLYSSGTTGKPKAIVHGTGGYLVHVNATQKWVFDCNEEDLYWCAADIGWVTGHSYIVFGPLLNGLSSILYEGAPDYPTPDRLWQIVERYHVSIFYTSPTAIRSLIKYGDQYPKKYDLSSLKILGTVGEPINPAAWEWYFMNIGGGRCPIVDTWWQTETGGIMISPTPRLGLVPLKPGSATYPLPGIEPEVLTEDGDVARAGEKGYLVIRKPWPGMLMTLHKDPERFKQVYWSRFPHVYLTGDYAVKDSEGYFWILGRADEVLKVAGHRLGTIEIEDVLVSHFAVAEAAVIGKPDSVKGEAVACFVTLKQGFKPSASLAQELREYVRDKIGPVATPEEVHFVKMLPKTRSGKIMRRVVRAVASNKEVGDLTALEDGASVDEVRSAVQEFKKEIVKS
jgi:acetyl-CoA synthetase